MKFRFFAVLHYMQLDNVKNKGTRIDTGDYKLRITNSTDEFNKYRKNPVVTHQMGNYSCWEFEESTYIYIDGNLPNVDSNDKMNEIGMGLAFKLLREVEYFIHHLWAIKDNGVYVRDGFLVSYKSNINDMAHVYKASLGAINSNSDGSLEKYTSFSNEELKSAQNLMNKEIFYFPSEDDRQTDSEKRELLKKLFHKYPTEGTFDKKRGSTRYLRALSFIIQSRSTSVLPLKIVSYVNALECLFTTSKSELNYRLSLRVSYLLEDNVEERVNIFKTVKDAYNLRSTVVHGEHINKNNDFLEDISNRLDQILRIVLIEYKQVFEYKNDQQLDQWFDNLIFTGSKDD